MLEGGGVINKHKNRLALSHNSKYIWGGQLFSKRIQIYDSKGKGTTSIKSLRQDMLSVISLTTGTAKGLARTLDIYREPHFLKFPLYLPTSSHASAQRAQYSVELAWAWWVVGVWGPSLLILSTVLFFFAFPVPQWAV